MIILDSHYVFVRVVLKSFVPCIMANAGVEKLGGRVFHSVFLCVLYVTEMLVSKELVYQDLRGLQMNALGEECKKAALITLNNCYKALVQ